MKRLFLLFAVLAVVATSCQKDTAESFNSGFANSPSNAITMEKACDNLKNILRDIDPQTRGSIRTIRDIKPFPISSFRNNITRTTQQDSTELLYLVNFEDNNGYAVVAANTLISPSVLFVTDSGSAEISDFETVCTINDVDGFSLDDLYYAPEDDYYLGAVDTQHNDLLLQQNIINNVVNFSINVSTDQTVDVSGSSYEDVNSKFSVNPLVNTDWYQGHPFNCKFTEKSESSGKIVPAGCTTIAVAQLLTCTKDRDIKTNFDIDGVTWNDLEDFDVIYGDTVGCAEDFDTEYLTQRDAVTKLIKYVADGIGVKYNYGIGKSKGTYGRPGKVVDYLESLGYKVEHKKNRSKISIETQQEINESLYKGYPVIVGGLGSIDGHWSGHAWLIDGCMFAEEENDWLCHLNLGWGGRGNGWYMRDCFDSTEQVNIEANNSIQEINIKPLAAEGEFRYTWMFNIIIIEY